MYAPCEPGVFLIRQNQSHILYHHSEHHLEMRSGQLKRLTNYYSFYIYTITTTMMTMTMTGTMLMVILMLIQRDWGRRNCGGRQPTITALLLHLHLHFMHFACISLHCDQPAITAWLCISLAVHALSCISLHCGTVC